MQSDKLILLEERIKLAVEATGIGTWDFDPVQNITRYDDQCKKLFGFSVDQEFTYSDFIACINPKDRILRDDMLLQALQGENNGRYETRYRIKTKDEGKIRWIKSKGKVFFNAKGKAIRLIGAMLDITEEKINEELLKESEERFRLASESSTAMIWMSGKDKMRHYFNNSWLKFTGKTLEQEIGTGWADGIFPEDYEKGLQIYLNKFDRREEYYIEYRLRSNNGTYRWISDAGIPRFSPAGLFEGYIGTCIDIHDQKMTREQLEQLVLERTTSLIDANKQLEASNQNLSEFAYVASHDLQEPLRKIDTFSQQLKERNYGEQTEEVKRYLNKITDASKRMSRLIEDLLNYARLQNMEDAKVPTDLNKIVETVVSDFDLEISQSDATIEVGDLPTIQAIPMRMSQLFNNLLSNSLKFVQAGKKPMISIHSGSLAEEEKSKMESLNQQLDYYQIIFSDRGIGFNPEFSERIFNIFQRLNGRSEYEGTGIGLTICRKIVLNHHGAILANSKENEGSEFKIILPKSR
jgi:two-component system, chemotaxis family, CheB/CheR fusion protein